MAHQSTAQQLFSTPMFSKHHSNKEVTNITISVNGLLPALDIKSCMPPRPTAPHLTAAPCDPSPPLPIHGTGTLKLITDLAAVLGRGQFSTVYRGMLLQTDGPARECAVKVPHTNSLDARELVLVEAAGLALLGLQAPGIVQCFGMVDLGAATDTGCTVVGWADAGRAAVSGSGHWAEVLELCENGNCWEWMQANRAAMDAERFFVWARQLAVALGALADAGMAHKDIKPHNLLIDRSGNVRLADFTATEFSPEAIAQMQRVCPEFCPEELPAYTDFSGTIPYSAPEALQFTPGARSDAGALHKMDIFSAGVTLYTLFVSGLEPYAAVKSSVEQMHLAARGAFWEWEDRQYLAGLPNRAAETAPPSPIDAVPPMLDGGALGRSLSLGRRRTLRRRKAQPREFKRFLSGDLLPENVEALLRDMLCPDPALRPGAREVLRRLNAMEPDIFEPAD